MSFVVAAPEVVVAAASDLAGIGSAIGAANAAAAVPTMARSGGGGGVGFGRHRVGDRRGECGCGRAHDGGVLGRGRR